MGLPSGSFQMKSTIGWSNDAGPDVTRTKTQGGHHLNFYLAGIMRRVCSPELAQISARWGKNYGLFTHDTKRL